MVSLTRCGTPEPLALSWILLSTLLIETRRKLSNSGQNIFNLLVSCPLSEILKINLLPKSPPQSHSLFQVNLAIPEFCRGKSIYYQILNSHNPYQIRASVDDACLLRVFGE